MNWISVKDRLPEFNARVWLWNGHIFTGWRFNDDSYEDGITGDNIYCVTHWCEITEPSE